MGTMDPRMWHIPHYFLGGAQLETPQFLRNWFDACFSLIDPAHPLLPFPLSTAQP